jgi:hypothetical protein
MVVAVTQTADRAAASVDAVAATARASKATVYRPSKAELVLAAFTEGVRQSAVPPDTGTLRGDLLPGYLIFRSITSSRPPTRRTVQVLVDDVIISSLSCPTG